MLTKWEEYLERIVKEKECRITWVGIEEKGTPQATAAFDREAIKEVIDASGDDELVAEWTNRRIDVRRFPESLAKKGRTSEPPRRETPLCCTGFADTQIEKSARTGKFCSPSRSGVSYSPSHDHLQPTGQTRDESAPSAPRMDQGTRDRLHR
ncbi:unnamed protein product [Cylicocyclus nassatus]|uniref:Uncharacterized protein n=1 Tax=Cylicocyclus nassatus TaxID=53992 RepID=A0AA36GZ38_CYLNA|nr:unnamed protein product [Cylicocyclus nassatus]